jgi:ParB-like chromosome segregation protein Spo0J
MSKQKRRVRLFGTGQTNDRFGGGMPIASMVSQMLDHLQDNGPTPIVELITMVEQRHHKRERLEYVYHKGHKLDGDAYALFIDDVIAELELAEIAVRQEGDRLALGPAFKLGERLPLPDGMGAIVYEKATRETIGRASLYDLEIKSLANDLRLDRPGIRTINKDNVGRLAESMRAFGYMPQFPVWLDQHGRCLSGRHRIQASELAGVQYLTRVIEVESDREALAIAFTANEGAHFSRVERERIAKRLSAAGLDVENIGKVIGNAGKRLLIQAKLLEDPARSDRSIGKEIGVHNETVGAQRRELEATDGIRQLNFRVGDDAKERPAHRPKAAPITTPPDFALHSFDEAVTALKQLVTRPSALFENTVHSADDLEKVESFIRAVADRARKVRSP